MNSFCFWKLLFDPTSDLRIQRNAAQFDASGYREICRGPGTDERRGQRKESHMWDMQSRKGFLMKRQYQENR